MREILIELKKLKNLARREHFYCEVCWYSCPKTEGVSSDDSAGNDCTCGADKHNEKVMELYEEISSLITTGRMEGRP